MAKKSLTPKAPSNTVNAPPPNAVEVDSPLISSELDAVVAPSRMVNSYLTVDSRMDSSDITVNFSVKEEPALTFVDIVDSSGVSGAREIPIPLEYLTRSMGFTLLISYEGKVQGQAAVSLVKEIGVTFYPANESDDLAPRLLHEKIVHNTPTYDMHDHTGDEAVLVPVHPLAKEGDKIYCTVATEQDAIPHVFYTVAYDYELTAEEAVPGHVLTFYISRGWLARRKPWRSLTLQSAWITSGLPAEPPAEIDPHLETRLPRNALEVQRRRTAALIVDPGLENLPPPNLRQSVLCNGNDWCLNPELTKNGGDVDVAYPDMTKGDKVCAYLSGPGQGTVSLGCVQLEDGQTMVSFDLSSCAISCFFNKPLTLSYTVAYNDHPAQPSPERVVEVLAPRLNPANIDEATRFTLDLNTFSGNATAVVPLWAYASCSSCCWMWITGEHSDGGAFRFDLLMDAPVTDDWKMHGVDTPIPRRQLQNLADCSDFELHFAVSFCETCDLANAIEAPSTCFHVVQEKLVLLKPSVTEAVGDNLEVWNGRNGIHVEVDYLHMSPHQTISVCWLRKDGTCWPLLPKPGGRPGPVIFSLPPEAVIEAIGTRVTINYTVTSACKQATSEDLQLYISEPVRVPTPQVPEATRNILDLCTLCEEDAHILVEPWWFALENQKVWLQVIGTKEDGSAYKLELYKAKALTHSEVTQGLKVVLPHLELEKLQDASELTIICKVTPDGSDHEHDALVFPHLDLILRKPLNDFTPFTGGNWNEWIPGPAALGEMRYSVVFGKPCVVNGTASTAAVGVVLFKAFDGLEVGHTYKFGIQACTYNGALPYPRLSLSTDAGTVTGVKLFSNMVWTHLEGTFIASSQTMVLQVVSHEPIGVSGNDYGITDIRVQGCICKD